jgi:RNA polymerase sigma-70 factor (ECF subfamily)
MIEPLEEALSGYFYFFGVKGAFLMELGRKSEAREAFNRAMTLASTAAEAAQIRVYLERLAGDIER